MFPEKSQNMKMFAVVTVYPVGSWVEVAEGVLGQVLSFAIYDRNMVKYRVVWWDEGKRVEKWMHDLELTSCEEDAIELRFFRYSDEACTTEEA